MSASLLQQGTDHYVKKCCVIFIFTINYYLSVRHVGKKNCVGFFGVDKFVVYGEIRRSLLDLEEFGNCSKLK
jgi:hypothetical protein